MNPSDVAEALWTNSPSLFPGSTASHSLGWLEHYEQIPDTYASLLGQWNERGARHEETLLIGMGGASSGAALLSSLIQNPHLRVLDSTCPSTVRDIDFTRHNVIAASKSGGTIEMWSLLRWALGNGLEARDLWIVTDPGSKLEAFGREIGAKVVAGDPKTGGRFSIFSAFGILPAIAAGVPLEKILGDDYSAFSREEFEEISRVAMESVFDESGHYVFPLAVGPLQSRFSQWIDQLVAESTGKAGRGVVPAVGAASVPSSARGFFSLQVVAASLAGYLEVDPFNQPDVELTKINAENFLRQDVLPSAPVFNDDRFWEDVAASRHLTLQVFGNEILGPKIETLRAGLSGLTTTVTANVGPRFLHSTGQLHKGGPSDIVCLQIIVPDSAPSPQIPDYPFSFEQIFRSQYMADRQALEQLGRRVHTIEVMDPSDLLRLARA